MNNIVIASFGNQKKTTTRKLYQYDYGIVLQIVGIALPEIYEVHFCNYLDTATEVVTGTSEGVQIPNRLLETGKNIIAYIYLHTGDDDGETVAQITIPVEPRPIISGTVDIPTDPNTPIDM